MSRILGISFALATALVAIPTLLSSASAAPLNRSTNNLSNAVYSNNGSVIGEDPDPSIRSMLLRDQPGN